MTKVVMEAMKERLTKQGLAQKFEISQQQANLWKRGSYHRRYRFLQGIEIEEERGRGKGGTFAQGDRQAKSRTGFFKGRLVLKPLNERRGPLKT